MTPWVAGADGCRGLGPRSTAWYVVCRQVDTGELRFRVVPDATGLLSLAEPPVQLAVDVPIGLPEHAERGGRPADREARALLGRPRGSSVFSAPARGALEGTTYAEASALNRASSSAGLGLSKQCFFLFDRIRDVDEQLVPSRQDTVFEAHPELAFFAMTGEPIVASKTTVAGTRARIEALLTAGLDPRTALAQRPNGVKPNDIVDAFAMVWVAERRRCGQAVRVPESPGWDVRGLRMEIWR